MQNTELVSMAQQFTGLPMESLIGGPLNAVAMANSNMALTQTFFMLNTCFTTKTETTDNTISYEPIMIKMKLIRGVINKPDDSKTPLSDEVTIQQLETHFDLPLLTIIPLNSLAVETADVAFEMEVKSSFSEDENSIKDKEIKSSVDLESKMKLGPVSISIKGSASYASKDSETHNTHYEKSNSAKYTVNVHAGQLPLPKGVNTIIEAFTQAISPIDVSGKKGAKSVS